MNTKNTLIFIMATYLTASGCSPAISQAVRTNADESLTIQAVIENPGAYEGMVVLWAGVIIQTKNMKEGTIIEILQKPADYSDRPKSVDVSGGRFLAEYDGFLDPEIYSQGRQLTVAGKIMGTREFPVGEYDYTYPLIRGEEIHLWPVEPERIYYHYYSPSYYPWWRNW